MPKHKEEFIYMDDTVPDATPRSTDPAIEPDNDDLNAFVNGGDRT